MQPIYSSNDGELQMEELKQHRRIIDELCEKELTLGESWYIIERHWFDQWKTYTNVNTTNAEASGAGGTSSTYPGPIDNSPILERDTATNELALKPDLMEGFHFVFVPEEAWRVLKEKFGLVMGQKELQRQVIETGVVIKQLKIEVYPLKLSVCLFSDAENVQRLTVSRSLKTDVLCKIIKERFKLSDNYCIKIYLKHANDTLEHLKYMVPTSLEEFSLYSGQTLIVDVQNADGTWNVEQNRPSSAMETQPTLPKSSIAQSPPLPTFQQATSNSGEDNIIFGSSSSPLTRSMVADSTFHLSGSGKNFNPPGLCGLSNLGNTCFMNSALQCMSNTPPLSDYFVGGNYEREINESNPLGMHGEMARAFGDLLKQIWCSKNQVVIPRQFKTTVGRFAPQFSGYQQQDSQELLAFLLDGLHEDLNRVRKKPYIETKDYDGKDDKEAADESWANYKLRNDSIVVDLFHGLLKSTLVCPECCKRSVTFDPFCYLSLPLPAKRDRQMIVTFVPLNTNQNLIQCQVTVMKNSIIRDLIEAVAHLLGKNVDQLILTEIYNGRFQKIFTSNERVNLINDRDDIVAYEVPTDLDPAEHPISLRIYNRFAKKQSGSGFNFVGSSNLSGIPMLLMLKRSEFNYNGLRAAAMNAARRFIDIGVAGENINVQNENENDSGVDENGDSNPANQHEDNESFRMIVTNSFGSSEFNCVEPNSSADSVLKPDGTSEVYICLEWNPSLEKRFRAHPNVDRHESMYAVGSNKAAKKNINLSECLDLFTTNEQLGKHDLWHCPRCKKHQQATKKFDLWSVPEILIIHLKRFSYSSYYRDKIESLIEFPLEKLNIRPWVVDDKMPDTFYDLIAVSNHYGGLGGGHYTAYAKNKINSKWYLFDDSRVSHADENEVISKAAYVLIYQRRHDNGNRITDPNFDMEDGESD